MKDENYIKKLNEILAYSNYTQTTIAKRLDITHAALNRWLKGHSTPHPRRIVSIDKLYKELVGYPSITEKSLKEISNEADSYKVKNLWKTISQNIELQNELLLEHTYNSTSIEGTTFTKRETEGVLFSGAIISDKSLKEHLEITNHAAILRSVFNGNFPGPIDETFIKHLHGYLMQGLHNDAGFYSKHERVIRGLDIALTHPKNIPEEMSNLISRWQNRSKNSIREIADFHISFELIHPFGDGNGRLGRIIMVYQCLKYGFPPVIIENSRKMEYYDVLEYAQTKSDGPFVDFLQQEMERTKSILLRYGVCKYINLRNACS